MKKKIVVFTLLLGLLFVTGCSSEGSDEVTGGVVVSEGIKEFDVIAKQWEFIPSIIKVNQGDQVRLKVTSTDVDHGIAIPQFGINQVAPVGQTVTMEFTADKKGQFPMICSVYCGHGHMNHRGMLIVE
jgi:cytochrome c oxidase subunit II